MDAHDAQHDPMFEGGWTKDGEEGCLETAVKIGGALLILAVMAHTAWTLLAALWT